MKKILSILALAALLPVSAMAWGRLGHCTVMEIASRHLTPTAKAEIERIMGRELKGEDSFWLDKVSGKEPYKTEYAGWHASIATPGCSSPLYIRKQYRECHDAVTAVYFLMEYLKDYKSMPDSTVRNSIKCLIHAVGDFHCPCHVRFTDNLNDGKFPVVWEGEPNRLHTVWDSGVLSRSGFSWKEYKDYAAGLDTWNKKQIRNAQKGWAREWFEDAARDIRPIVGTIENGAVLTPEWADANLPLGELEIRKAGYQLAKALNAIFSGR